MRAAAVIHSASVLLCAVLLVAPLVCVCASPPARPGNPGATAVVGQHPMVLFDTDFGQLNDDARALHLLPRSRVEVLGVTTVSGNTWAAESAAHALRQLEVEGRTDIPVSRARTTRSSAPIGADDRRVGREVSR